MTTPDFTSTNLEAALLDQIVAGTFPGKRYAFVPVHSENGCGWQLGVAVNGERGYHPVAKVFPNRNAAKEWADGLNDHIKLTPKEVAEIVISSMRKGKPR